MLINLTNHPHAEWDEAQKQAATQYGECVDLAFPAIDPQMDSDDIDLLADEYLQQIKQLAAQNEAIPVVHLMGEMTFLYRLVRKLEDAGIACVASTSERVSIDLGNGTKNTIFKFVKFRNYY